MSQTTALGRTWDEASSPAAARLARRFDADWRKSSGGSRPEPARYIPDDVSDHSGAWLALLRAEMNLRWESQEPFRVELFQRRYPSLDEQVMVALLYEEYCLREESGVAPDASEYEGRFPELASRLRRVLEIHDLVGGSGSIPSTASMGGLCQEPGPPLPEKGETIGGFRLVEELGRGSFARVFLAQERLLADRPVALKVSRTGSREPQTLAGLQHTHIVPVHSYRTDQVSGLHMLCMPYFGRVTLAMMLAEPGLSRATTGAELLGVLDRLQAEADDGEGYGPRPLTGQLPEARRALSARSYAGAIAWWGARLAEALQHAHDRGVLHRDLKPSNVLVTADGMPMLVDFNLAQTVRLEVNSDESPGRLGGTLPYMAPEHLEALADGVDEGGDARADIFAMGVVLFETLAGRRPFVGPKDARSIADALAAAAEERRRKPPRLVRRGSPVSPALETIVRRCLAGDPEDRYRSAGELAADLQAFADDEPLRHAREPLPSRSVRWIRRNRARFALAVPALAATVVLAAMYHDSRVGIYQEQERLKGMLDQGKVQAESGELDKAIATYESLEKMTDRRPEFEGLASEAHDKLKLAEERKRWRDSGEQAIREAHKLNYRLLGFVDDREPLEDAVARVVDPFYVRMNAGWDDAPHMSHLEDAHRRELVDAIDQTLFLWLAKRRLNEGGPEDPAGTDLAIFDRACNALPAGDPRRGPWLMMLGQPVDEPDPMAEESFDAGWRGAQDTIRATAAFYWAVAHRVEYQKTAERGGRFEARSQMGRALAWLERACRERPDHYWSRFYLTSFSIELDRLDAAIEHADVAVSLRPDEPWARFNRAEAHRRRDELNLAKADFEFAESRVPTDDEEHLLERVWLNLGLTLQAMGDRSGALARYDRLIAEGKSPSLKGAARLNRAGLLGRIGRAPEARAELNSLLSEEAGFVEARWARAELDAEDGDWAEARADLDRLIAEERPRATWFSTRARVSLMEGNPASALDDATAAAELEPSEANRRLLIRAHLANHRAPMDLVLDDPEVIDGLPVPGRGLFADLRATAATLESETSTTIVLARAVLLAAAGDWSAERVASSAVSKAPRAPLGYLVRGRLRFRAGDLEGARRDAEEGILLDPQDRRLLALRGRISLRLGDARSALNDLDRAVAMDEDDAGSRAERALALTALGRPRSALQEWASVVEIDPADPFARIGLARAYEALGDDTAAKRHREAALSTDRPELAALIALPGLGSTSVDWSTIRRTGTLLARALVAGPPGE